MQQAHFFGLDDINFHYNNWNNEVSRLITRSVQMYDSALISPYEWMQMYRYVASVNIALIAMTSGYKEIKQHFETLIENTDGYIVQTDDMDLNTVTFEEFYSRRSKMIKKFYTIRSQILHGNLIGSYDRNYDKSELNIMRELAHNTIRLMARCARRFAWQTKNEVEEWFKNPVHIQDIPD